MLQIRRMDPCINKQTQSTNILYMSFLFCPSLSLRFVLDLRYFHECVYLVLYNFLSK